MSDSTVNTVKVLFYRYCKSKTFEKLWNGEFLKCTQLTWITRTWKSVIWALWLDMKHKIFTAQCQHLSVVDMSLCCLLLSELDVPLDKGPSQTWTQYIVTCSGSDTTTSLRLISMLYLCGVNWLDTVRSQPAAMFFSGSVAVMQLLMKTVAVFPISYITDLSRH